MSCVLIVGAGVGGLAAADYLAARDHTVTVFERGASAGELQLPPILAAAGNAYPQGRGVGGSSLINGGVIVPATSTPANPVTDMLGEPVPVGPLGMAILERITTARRVRALRVNHAPASIVAAFDHLDSVTIIADRSVRRIVTAPAVVGGQQLAVQLDDGQTHSADAIVLSGGVFGTPALIAASGLTEHGFSLPLDSHSVAWSTPTPSGYKHGHRLANDRRAEDWSRGLYSVSFLIEDDVQVLVAEQYPNPDWAGLIVAGPPVLSRAVFDVRVAQVRALIDAVGLGQRPWSFAHGPTVFHAAGTCRDLVDERGALDQRGRIVVADAASMSTSVTGNMMLAVRDHARVVARSLHRRLLAISD